MGTTYDTYVITGSALPAAAGATDGRGLGKFAAYALIRQVLSNARFAYERDVENARTASRAS